MKMYRGDLKPDLTITCYDGTTPVDLTAATTVYVIGRADSDGSIVFNRAATSKTAQGVVTMEWQSADTEEVGVIAVEVEVTWPGSKKQTFRPNALVSVVADYA